ncbi:uncharacterized protein LOC127854902 isoform X1 [Dreissena polymorpha]|nr:uncharacterized protein LOC127854902 isoform X1 [Dreissena polymorpha]
MKTNGEYDTFANLHRGIVETSAHRGPNFLGWHRVYLALFEEAIRRINRQISLPYWDSTLDFDMDNPVNTILFSAAFFGNGDGQVTTGPFANWVTPIGPLTRNIGGGSQLFSKEIIRSIMTRCRTRDITRPTALPQFDLEFFHGGPHVWVGGQLSGLNTAAHDPVFFLHHACVDYIWELFRNHQFFDCRVDPSSDYPVVTGQHLSTRAMDGLPGYRNIDGYRNYWTQNWYRYERSPTCPVCNSPYLTCNPARKVCVSIERTLAPDEAVTVSRMAMAADGNALSPQVSRARAQVALLDIGTVFDAPPAELRTQMGQASAVRRKRALKQYNKMSNIAGVNDSQQQNGEKRLEVGEQFLAPESDGRTSDVLGRNIASGVFLGKNDNSSMQDVYSGKAFPVAQPMSLVPVPVSNTLDLYMKNPSSYITKSSASDWLFAPVHLLYNVVGYDTNAQTPSMKCLPSDAISTSIKVSAQGLNYLGEYTDFAVVDISNTLPSANAIIAIRAPEVGPSISMVTASHGCGLMCKPMCFNTETGPSYKPCTGIMWIKPEDATAYVRSYDEAAESLAKGGTIFPILFQCHKESQSPWKGQ